MPGRLWNHYVLVHLKTGTCVPLSIPWSRIAAGRHRDRVKEPPPGTTWAILTDGGTDS